jgi:hypothetical protein
MAEAGSSPGRAKMQRKLAELYAAMSERELRQLAAVVGSLTENAREVLRSELMRRGMKIGDLLETASPGAHVELRDLVLLRHFADLPGALLAKSILESAGIECFLGDDNLIRLDWFLSNLLGGVKLKVRREDADEAEGLLGGGGPPPGPEAAVDEPESPCPVCCSPGISFNELSKATSRAANGRPSVAPLSRRRWRCAFCGNEWTDLEPGNS